MKEIRVYRTHIEVYPYEQGEQDELEKSLSIWDDVFYRFIPIGYYIENRVLYLPRGYSLSKLEKMFHSEPRVRLIYDDYDGLLGVESNFTPRDEAQIESMKFLNHEGRFKKGSMYAQFVLNLPTDTGKTSLLINHIVKSGMKTIIIGHKTNIKVVWKAEFLKFTNINEDDIVDIDSSSKIDQIMNGELEGLIYQVNHQTIHSYASSNGWDSVREFFRKLRVGIKIIDEAHKHFANIIMIDFFSNCKYNYYLTATFDRTNYKEKYIYKTLFANAYKFGDEVKQYKTNVQHVIYCPVYYTSNPSQYTLMGLRNAKFISVHKVFNYQLKEEEQNLMKMIFNILEKVEHTEGRILITATTIEGTETIAKMIKDSCITSRTVGFMNSKQTDEEKEYTRDNADIIVSTILMLGTGDNIENLRVVINCCTFSNKNDTIQLKGRLRRYKDNRDTYLFDLVDVGIPDCERMQKDRERVIKKDCKEIRKIYQY